MQKLRACKGVYVSVCVHVCVCLCVTLWIDPLPVVITSFFFQAGTFNDGTRGTILSSVMQETPVWFLGREDPLEMG